MTQDMSPVGASVTTSKGAAGMDGSEVFDPAQGVRIVQTDNGGAILTASMKKVQKPRRGELNYPSYCPDKQYAFDDLKDAFTKAHALFGRKVSHEAG